MKKHAKPSFLHSFISSFSYYISFATVIAILLVLPATMIRASWLAASAGALVVAWPWLKKNTCLGAWLLMLGSNLKYKIAAISLGVVLVGAIGFGLFHLKKGSSVGKLFIWEVTLGKIAEKPLFGYGVGRFEAEYNNWQAEYFMKHPEEMDGPKGMAAGNTKYAFSDFLEIVAEIGIWGLFLFIVLMRQFFLFTKEWNVKLIRDTDCSSSLIVPFLIFMLVSFPMYSLPILMSLLVLLAIISSQLFNYIIVISNTRINCILSIFGIVVGASILISGSLFLMLGQYKGFYYWNEADILYSNKEYTEACRSFEKVLKPMKYNGNFLHYYGKSIQMKMDYFNSINRLLTARNFISDDVLYITIGECSTFLKQYDQAEKAFSKVNYMIPNKMLSLFFLAKFTSVALF